MQNSEGAEDKGGASIPFNPRVSDGGSIGGSIHRGTIAGSMTDNNAEYSARKGEESAAGEYRSASGHD